MAKKRTLISLAAICLLVVAIGAFFVASKPGYFLRVLWFATHGDPEAQVEVGGCWFSGFGVPVDREKGIKWLTRSAQAGFDQAQGTLGRMLLHGDQIPQDTRKGLTLLHQGASQGNSSPRRPPRQGSGFPASPLRSLRRARGRALQVP